MYLQIQGGLAPLCFNRAPSAPSAGIVALGPEHQDHIAAQRQGLVSLCVPVNLIKQ